MGNKRQRRATSQKIFVKVPPVFLSKKSIWQIWPKFRNGFGAAQTSFSLKLQLMFKNRPAESAVDYAKPLWPLPWVNTWCVTPHQVPPPLAQGDAGLSQCVGVRAPFRAPVWPLTASNESIAQSRHGAKRKMENLPDFTVNVIRQRKFKAWLML